MGPSNQHNNGDQKQDLDDLLPTGDDILYEEELLRNPYNLRMWIRYIDARKDAHPKKRYMLYERALKALPGSYKLWHAYLSERRAATTNLRIDHPSREALANTYARALVTMHKMPRIWTEYLEFMTEQQYVTRTRRAFDRALMSLPVTQHDRVWVLYLKFITQPGIPAETAVRVYRRYLKLEPAHAEEFLAYLKIKDRWGEAARILAAIVSDEAFRSIEGKSKHQLWLELCNIITKHPDDVVNNNINVEAVLRSGIRRYTDEVGRLWTSLADYFIRRGMFEKARDIYEEGITSVMTVRDFSLVFDALTQFEESLLAAKMEQIGDDEEEEEDDDADGDGTDFVLKDGGNDLDMRLARLEHLMERRPELLSSVVLRQNPHNVHEWHKRARLFASDPAKQIMCYTEAIKTVDPEKAVGKPNTLWLAFAKLYERHEDLDNARVIFEKAVEAHHKYVDDLANIWCEWAEMELRHKRFTQALELVRQATEAPARRRSRDEESGMPVQERLYRSLKLWSFYIDLEESLGTFETAKAAYETALDLKIATAQMVLNYAAFLRENKYFEDSFRAYERGIAAFKYPHVKDIWQAYLTQFVERYGGKKVERTRDLFKQAVQEAPAEEAKPLYLQYAAYEEKYGLARNAMEIYAQAVVAVPMSQRLSVLDVYLARASEFFGVGKVREIYETSIEATAPDGLSDSDAKTICLRYAALERKLGEIDRARAIYIHGASLADPRSDKDFWSAWNDFEVKHGNEETFREMLRIKRSVAASFSQQHFNTAVIDASAVAAASEAGGKRKFDDMAALEADLLEEQNEPAAAGMGTRVPGFVSAGIIQQGDHATKEAEDAAAAAAANPEDIDIGDDFDDEDGEGQGGEDDVADVVEKAVPDAVFGSLAGTFKKQKTGDE